MKVIDIIKGNKPSLSFEVFPPKTTDKFESVKEATEAIASLNPSFMSVTYGAGGGTSQYTKDICKALNEYGVTSLAHLTCVSSDKERIHQELTSLKEKGIENILALRGDIPENFDKSNIQYHHASDLAKEIADFGGFCIGGACYPEGHPESESLDTDIINIGKKVEAGCSFLTTQMFFNNDILYSYIDKLHRKGIFVPVVAGIMPITNARQIMRSCELSGTVLPKRFIKIAERYGDNPAAMKQAGIAYATEQIIDLYASGIRNVHVYSMNKPDVAAEIQRNLSEIIKG